MVPVTDIQPEATADRCRFCGDRTADIFGEARSYVRWPDEVDRADGVFQFTICEQCALQRRSNVEQAASLFHEADRDYLLTCDVCGAVGCQSASTRRPAADTYRVASIVTWSVTINGFDGATRSCVDCSPIVPVECVKSPDRTYNDELPRLVEPPFDSVVKTAADAPTDSEQVEIGGWVG
ncbi:hypothetical protein C437_08773 [Haloarcula vallismortis ATCC 29715]|uniref:Uncharacterized protein n=1 Tax=Haloarcula vallismortis ATCC 29715 TaxID=662477 RepID=M0JJC3_HALVA|nr:hypothetical protein [Haloarcula vallismortis]EMA07805.1 hypothetical protein C437_08773 [Haloarcula vallismortis ATCC 29715]